MDGPTITRVTKTVTVTKEEIPLSDATFGERVAYYRNQLGMSQRAFADHIELTQHWLAQVESGAQCNPTLNNLIKLVAGLGLDSLDELVYGPTGE
jgi:transcriptional regulator with XRE-family HTH domain